jgi:hypothetical protein
MDVSSKDFSLNFRGFEHNDPETVERFTTFCAANFALSPEQVTLLKSTPNTIVLTQGGSIDELEALAKVLREIGALVDVSADTAGDLPSLLGTPSTQELHRLFGARTDASTDASAPSCPYPPPLGRSLYLLTNSDAVVDRRTLRRKLRKETVVPHDSKRSLLAPHRTLLIVTALTIGVGVAALTAAAVLLKKESHSDTGTTSVLSHTRTGAGTRINATSQEDAPPRTLTSTTNANGLGIELKITTSGDSVSVSSLTFLPKTSVTSARGVAVKRIEGDPTFLSQRAPGTWGGTVLLSIFLEGAGAPSHFTTPAEVEIRVNDDRSLAQASIRTQAHGRSRNGTIEIVRLSGDTYAMSEILVEDLTLS